MTYEICIWDIVYCILSNDYQLLNAGTITSTCKSWPWCLWITFTVTTDISKTEGIAATSWRASAYWLKVWIVGSVFVILVIRRCASDATSDVAAGFTTALFCWRLWCCWWGAAWCCCFGSAAGCALLLPLKLLVWRRFDVAAGGFFFYFGVVATGV